MTLPGLTQLWQLSDVGCDTLGLVVGEWLGGRLAAGLVLNVPVSQRLPA